MQHEDRCQPLKKRLISTVRGNQAREQPLAPEKFSAGCCAPVTVTAASGVKSLSPHRVSRHRNLHPCLYCGQVLQRVMSLVVQEAPSVCLQSCWREDRQGSIYLAVLHVTSALWSSTINCVSSGLAENFISILSWQISLCGICALQAFRVHCFCSDLSPLLLS